MSDTFKALIATRNEDRKTEVSIKQITTDDLPEGEVLVSVDYSTLNYKDGLAVTGAGPVIRKFPLVPGIDLAGTVEQSSSSDYKPGDKVVLTGWGVGEEHWGGFAQKARVQAGWLVPLPDGLTLKQAMGFGTAGFTAMLCIMALEENGLTPDAGEVVVTGASGGVGSVAVAMLAQLGYTVVASTGKSELKDYMTELGAAELIGRSVLGETSKRPMDSTRWAGAVDTVGSDTLASVIKTLQPEASVAACGLAGGSDLSTTVFPFILRGVNLLGINSVTTPFEHRQRAWRRLAADLPLTLLDKMMETISLEDVPAYGQQIVKGKIRGRVVVDLNG